MTPTNPPSSVNGLPPHLYHATSRTSLNDILVQGLKNPYLTASIKIAEYYAEITNDEGKDAVILIIPMTALRRESLEPDYPGIEEPLTYTLGLQQEEIQVQWNNSRKSWQDSINIIESCRYRGTIEPKYVTEATK